MQPSLASIIRLEAWVRGLGSCVYSVQSCMHGEVLAMHMITLKFNGYMIVGLETCSNSLWDIAA